MGAEVTEVKTVKLTINGSEVEAQVGQTILEAARAAGIDIPTLCHDPRLEPYGACRLCLVEVEGARGPMASCGTKISDGMKIETHSEKIVKLRKFILELLLTNHPLDCPVCEAAGDCRLQDYAYEYQVDMIPWGWRAPEPDTPGEHPNVAHFGARCVLCGRCVRICREVMSIGCWGYLNRGYETEVDTPYRRPLQEVGCVSCGQCVSTCPVGAITSQRAATGARQWQTEKARTTCSYCANGCEIVVHGYNGRVVRVGSALERGLNQGNLCVKGRFGHGYVNSPNRMLKPMVKDASGRLQEATWEEALTRISDEATRIKAEAGGEAFAAICGTHMTNEAAYLAKKLLQEAFGSTNIAASDQAGKAPVQEALGAAFGSAAATGNRGDLALADVILVIGSNVTESSPVLALNVIKAIRKGKTVVVVDPRTTEVARRASIHLAPKPGTDLAILRAMMAHIVGSKLEDSDFIAGSTEGCEALKQSIAKVNVDAEAETAGVDAGDLRAAAEAFANADAGSIIFGGGITGAPDAVEAIKAIADLAMLTGNVGKPGAAVIPQLSGANSQGLTDMGIFKSPQEVLAGANPTRFLYIVGADPVGGEVSLEGLTTGGKAPFIVVQDSFLSESAGSADVVLPAAVPTEDEGTYTNGERFVQRVRPAVVMKPQSVPGWMIIYELAKRMGVVWPYTGPFDVMTDIAQEVPGYAGASYGTLERGGASRPYDGKDKLSFQEIGLGISPIDTNAERPFALISGSVLQHHETGVRTREADGLTKLCPQALAEINPADAENLGVVDGGSVKITGATGNSIEITVAVTDRVPAGVVFVPVFDPAVSAAKLTVPGSAAVAGVQIKAV